jgi:hypothetical protein
MAVPGVSALSTFGFSPFSALRYSAGSHQAVPRCLLSEAFIRFSLLPLCALLQRWFFLRLFLGCLLS